MAKYRRTYQMFDTEEDAKNFCTNFNDNATYYIRKNKPATYNRCDAGFVAWYYIAR